MAIANNDVLNKNIMKQLNLSNASPSSEDLKEQAEINNALIKAGLPQNKLNSLLALVQDRLFCDANCQKNRTSEKLKKALDDAQNNLKTAPEQVENAEKNYYLYSKGTAGYRDYLFDKYSKNAEEMKEKSLKKHNEMDNEIKTLIAKYDAELVSQQRMEELLQLRINENKELKNKIDHIIGVVETNDRKVVYEQYEQGWLGTIKSILIFFYYILFIIYFIISDFFSAEKYKTLKGWLFVLWFMFFPFIINWLVVQLYAFKSYISHLYSNRPYKNVYEHI